VIAPLTHSIPNEELLPDLRAVLSPWPHLAERPEALAALLGIGECEVGALLEALTVEGEVLA
jgi:hypothetical protein